MAELAHRIRTERRLICRTCHLAKSWSFLLDATPEHIEALIAQRVKRQELLYGPGRHVQTSGTAPSRGVSVMPLSGFWLDDDAVYIETFTGEQQLTGPASLP